MLSERLGSPFCGVGIGRQEGKAEKEAYLVITVKRPDTSSSYSFSLGFPRHGSPHRIFYHYLVQYSAPSSVTAATAMSSPHP